jgi:putative membrane protein
MVLLHSGLGGPRWLDWSLHWDMLLFTFVLAYAYYYAVTRLRPVVSDAGRVKRSQVLLFGAGLGSLYLGGGTPLHDLGEEYLLTAHMLQHFMFTMAAPPLLIAGTPAWLWEWLLLRRGVEPMMRVLTRPLIAFGLFNALLVLTHMPSVVDLALQVAAFHFAVHVVLILAALLMWWPILSPLPQLPRLAEPFQLAYLFAQSILPAVIASFITFSDRAVYGFYADAPRIWGITPLDDQQIAGGLMKILGSLVLWSFMTVIFFRWYGREEAASKEPAWPEVEAELSRMGLEQRQV